MSSGVYTCKATDITGVPEKGEITGGSLDEAKFKLKERGLNVTSIEEKATGLQMELSLMPKRVKAKDLTIMTRQLSVMVSSGMTLLRSFYVLEEQIEHPKLKEVLSQVREDIEGGMF